MYTKKERELYNKMRDAVCNKLGITVNQFNWFRRKGEELHNIYEDNCNGLFDTEESYKDAVNPVYELVNNKAEALGLSVYFQTDPRGATIYLDDKPIPENNYTTAYCIY